MTGTAGAALVRRFIGGDPAAAALIVEAAATCDDPALLVTAALIRPAAPDLLARAGRAASGTRERQLVAIAVAYLDGDADRVDALARDHLADHPDSLLVAWLAGAAVPHRSSPAQVHPSPPQPCHETE